MTVVGEMVSDVSLSVTCRSAKLSAESSTVRSVVFGAPITLTAAWMFPSEPLAPTLTEAVPLTYNTFEEVQAAYADKSLFSLDLKNALAESLVTLLEPVRKHFHEDVIGKLPA